MKTHGKSEMRSGLEHGAGLPGRNDNLNIAPGKASITRPRTLGRIALSVAAFLLLGLSVVSPRAEAQIPQWNRKLDFIVVMPDEDHPGELTIRAIWALELGSISAPVDLSTQAELRVNGATVGRSDLNLISVNWANAPGCSAECASDCWFANLDGGSAQLLECYQSESHCGCGGWFTARLPLPAGGLHRGDELTAILYPGPGAQPDPDTSDDQKVVVYSGGPMGWDRSVDRIEVVPQGPGRADIRATGQIAFEGLPGAWMNLGFVARLFINGVAIEDVVVAHEAKSYDTTCFQVGCGSYCGTHNHIEKSCDRVLFNDCGCGASWYVWWTGVPLNPGDDISVRLEAPHNVLPTIGIRNSYHDFGSDWVASVDPSSPVPHADLFQNAPNPFARAGSNGTSIGFSLMREGQARLDIISVCGRVVRTLAEGEFQPGIHYVSWDGRDDDGRVAPGGVYFSRLSTEDESHTRKILVAN